MQDIVVIDGRRVGWHRHDGGRLPVFDALACSELAPLQTCYAVIEAPRREDLDALLTGQREGVGQMVDWTDAGERFGLRMRYSVRRSKDKRKCTRQRKRLRATDASWSPVRDIGMAVRDDATAGGVLAAWRTACRGRKVRFRRMISTNLGGVPDDSAWWYCGHVEGE